VAPAYGAHTFIGTGWVIVLSTIGQAQLLFAVILAVSAHPNALAHIM
jgi:hypothetical protein